MQWRLWARIYRRCNWRCYCPIGTAWRSQVIVGGWGLNCWAYVGAPLSPCACDDAIREYYGDEDE